MDKLFQGAIRFRKEEFERHKSLFSELGRKQKPHTLFVGCSDSRVVPNLITRTNPGELFIVRNIANIVPPYRQAEEYLATTAAVEYAIQALEVDTIVVCGHSNCGGCGALHSPPEQLQHLPHVARWLELSAHIPAQVESLMSGDSQEEREWLTEQLNVVAQMRNLLTYPGVRERVSEGRLKILGWYYIIETGEIYNYDPERSEFVLVT